METLYLPQGEKKYVVVNKDKILIVTYNRPYAERIDNLVKSNDYPKSYGVVVRK